MILLRKKFAFKVDLSCQAVSCQKQRQLGQGREGSLVLYYHMAGQPRQSDLSDEVPALMFKGPFV